MAPRVLIAGGGIGGLATALTLNQIGVDCVVRQHQLRTTDFRRGRRLGNGDHLSLIGWMWRLTSECPNRSKFAKSKS